MNNVAAFERAKLSLEGLAVGDAFGQKFFGDPSAVQSAIQGRILPDAPWWEFTDDTMMAIGIMQVLQEYGEINQDALAQTFARNYHADPTRGYGGMAFIILAAISQGYDWREVSSAAFEGKGSLGNGGAMRVAPLGAYFADDLPTVVKQARLSAEVTHFHPEGQAGAIAVAVAAAYVASSVTRLDQSAGKAMLMTALEYTPDGDTRKGLQRALALPFKSSIAGAVSLLGNGSQVTAPDTVPFALWCAARHLDNFEDALWATVSGLGDRDTTCAMVGGIVALTTALEGIPAIWLQAKEPLAGWLVSANNAKIMEGE